MEIVGADEREGDAFDGARCPACAAGERRRSADQPSDARYASGDSHRPLFADRASASSAAMFFTESSSEIGAGTPLAAACANRSTRIVYWSTASNATRSAAGS